MPSEAIYRGVYGVEELGVWNIKPAEEQKGEQTIEKQEVFDKGEGDVTIRVEDIELLGSLAAVGRPEDTRSFREDASPMIDQPVPAGEDGVESETALEDVEDDEDTAGESLTQYTSNSQTLLHSCPSAHQGMLTRHTRHLPHPRISGISSCWS